MARHFERGASSFRAFVEKLEADAECGEAEEAPIVEEGTEGVRVMTVLRGDNQDERAASIRMRMRRGWTDEARA